MPEVDEEREFLFCVTEDDMTWVLFVTVSSTATVVGILSSTRITIAARDAKMAGVFVVQAVLRSPGPIFVEETSGVPSPFLS